MVKRGRKNEPSSHLYEVGSYYEFIMNSDWTLKVIAKVDDRPDSRMLTKVAKPSYRTKAFGKCFLRSRGFCPFNKASFRECIKHEYRCVNLGSQWRRIAASIGILKLGE